MSSSKVLRLPSARTIEPVPHNLRPRRTELIGHADRVEGLLARIREPGRLLVLQGPPGVGKTRTAHAMASEVVQRRLHPRGVWFVDLTAARTREEVESALARALSITLRGTSVSASPGLREKLEGAFLVLDNFEQLVDVASDLVLEILSAVPSVFLLITSRVVLRLEGERLVQLDPLSLPDAGRLFVRRAQDVRDGFEVEDADQRVLEDVLERLDRNPLAIELAARQLATRSLRDLDARLREGLRFLQHDLRGVDPRHAALYNAIEWSWRLLPEWARDALGQCTAFRGGFSLDAAARVLASDPDEGAPDAEGAVRFLLQSSLISAYEVPAPLSQLRFRLYESVREFVAERTTPEQRRSARARHAAYYAEIAPRKERDFGGPEGAKAFAWLETELDNLSAAHEAAREEDPEGAARIVVASYRVFAEGGHTPADLARFDDAVACARRAGQPALIAHALWARGCLRIHTIEEGTAVSDLREAAELAQEAGDAWVEGHARTGLGTLLGRLGQRGEARQHTVRALELYESIGDHRAAGNVVHNLAVDALIRGDSDGCLERCSRALHLRDLAGNTHEQAITHLVMGMAHHLRGELPRAGASFETANEITSSEVLRISGRVLLAVVALERGEEEVARQELDECVRVAQSLGKQDLEGFSYAFFAAALGRGGAMEEATRALARSEELVASFANYADLPEVVGALLELERTRELDDPNARDGAVRTARGVSSRSQELGPMARIAGRLLRQHPDVAEDHPTLRLSRETQQATHGTDSPLDLRRRPTLWRVLEALASSPEGAAMGVQEIFEHGWPGQKIQPAAASRRVYTTIDRLRAVGLRDLIESSEDGYRLRKGLVVQWLD